MKLSDEIFDNWWLVESHLCLFAPKCCEGGGALQMIFYQVVNAVSVDSTQIYVGTQKNIVEMSWGHSNSNCYNQNSFELFGLRGGGDTKTLLSRERATW